MIDWGQVGDAFRSGIPVGLLVAIGLIAIFIVYYLTIASKKPQQIKVAKWRARKVVETGEIPDDRTYNYIVFMLNQAHGDTEAEALIKGISDLKSRIESEKH